METKNPSILECVVIAAPHTSNWDFLLTLLFGSAFGLKIKWMGESTLFIFPFGFFLRYVGEISLNRGGKSKLDYTRSNFFQVVKI